jgi:hypothetical protein
MERYEEQALMYEAQLRMFYSSCGLSKKTIEAAIARRTDEPVEKRGRKLRSTLTT